MSLSTPIPITDFEHFEHFENMFQGYVSLAAKECEARDFMRAVVTDLNMQFSIHI